MSLNTIRNKVRVAALIYRSGGMLILILRLIGFLWEQCVFLYVRARNREGFIERTVLGNKLHLNLGDTGITKELLAYGVHEPSATRLLRGEIKPGMRVVDIGANLGYYVLQETNLVGKDGEVIAIEPVPDNVNLLTINLKANRFNNVHIHKVAIGAENGQAKIWLSRESNWSSLIRRDIHSSGIEVPLYKLDTLIEQEHRIDYIRMDIEGYETEAIKGMRGILIKNRPSMFIEFHPFHIGGEASINFLEYLKKLGYETKYVIDKAFDYATVKRKHIIETICIDDLMLDKRVALGQGLLSLFLEAK